jgi:hypothetical protein
MELRDSKYESNGRIVTQKPLAIYVPSEKVELWRTGRKESKMRLKLEAHTDVELDMFRSYVMVYEWIKGIDAVDACNAGLLDESEMAALTLRVEKEMGQKGFSVKDRKPHHIILRPRGEGRLVKNRLGNLLYAVIDYELLVRTPERDEAVKKAKRVNYLVRQKNRFVMGSPKPTPPHLKQVNILGVNYIYGRAEITGGSLWVVGKDPDLFDYFLPERWESTQRTKLSSHHEIFFKQHSRIWFQQSFRRNRLRRRIERKRDQNGLPESDIHVRQDDHDPRLDLGRQQVREPRRAAHP